MEERKFVEEVHFITEKRAEAIYYLMNNYAWDLFLAVFTDLDRIQHVLFGYFDKESPHFNEEKRQILIEYYKKIDDILGKIISSVDKKTILIVVSDHGFEYLYKRVGLNDILVRGGFLRTKSKFQIFSSEDIINFLRKIGMEGIIKKISQKLIVKAQKVFSSRIDFVNSQAYGVLSSVYINKTIFENKETYESLENRLISFLYAVTDKYGSFENKERIVEKIFKKNEIYSGTYIDDAPDLTLVFRKGYEPNSWVKGTFESVKPMEKRTVKTGTHIGFSAQRGVFVILGEGIKEGLQTEANIIDIAPTILHILGIPIPSDMDGKTLKQIFEPESIFANKPVKCHKIPRKMKQQSYQLSEEETEDIKERLKSLGYM